MDAGGPGHLAQADDGVFHVVAADHHQVAQFVNNDQNIRQRLHYRPAGILIVLSHLAVVFAHIADAAGSKKLVMEGEAGVYVTNAVENYNKSNSKAPIKINYTDAGTQIILQHIEDGTTDFGIIDKAMYVSYAKTYGFKDLQSSDVPADEQAGITANLYSYFLFAQDNDALRQEVDTVLKELKADGTLTKIAEKYYSSDQAPEDDKYEKTIN